MLTHLSRTSLLFAAVLLASGPRCMAETEAQASATETTPTATVEVEAVETKAPVAEAPAEVAIPDVAEDAIVGLFEAREAGQIEVKFIAKNDHEGRILITNKLPHGVKVQLPNAFVADPVVAQFGGGGGGMGGGSSFGGGGGGGSQSMGGGGGGMGGGMGGGGMGGGGGVFSVPAERVTKINVPLLCLDHGKKDPSSSKPYELRPVDPSSDRPEVIELLKAFGNGQLQHNAAQAAAWHLNNDMTWQELGTKLTGTARSISRSPYFSRFELQAAYSYAAEANRLASEVEVTSPGENYESK